MSKDQTPQQHKGNMMENRQWWFAILQGLAGAHPIAIWGNDAEATTQEREAMKAAAAAAINIYKEPMHAAFRAPWWLLWAYSHWWRARENLDLRDADEYDQAFERGMNFRRYLGAWLWSIGIHQLSMTAADLEAIHECTGVAPLPHPMLPRGCSVFLHDCFPTTKVERIPAKNLDEASVCLAFANSQTA